VVKKINIVGKALERVEVTGPAMPPVEPSELAAALGAEPGGEGHSRNRDLISLGEVGNALVNRLRSTGGRPALEGASERCKVPLSPADVADLERVIDAIEAKMGTRPALGQVVSVILRFHLNSLRDELMGRRGA